LEQRSILFLERGSSHVKMVYMTARTQRAERLAARLVTGSGAIYYHAASKDELLAATTNDVIACGWAPS
jgi:hypothetical protein